MALQVTVSAWLYQPFPSAARDGVAETSGGVPSILIPVTVSCDAFPALSVHVPVADSFDPSLLTVCCTVEDTTPDPESVHDHVTVTSPLFQPPALAGVRLTKAIVGAVASYSKEKLPPPLFPALSVQLPWRVPLAVSIPL